MLTVRTILIMVVVLFADSAIAQSQVPSPTPGIFTDKPNKQNTNPQEKPEADQRGTNKTPIVIKVLPSQPSEPVPTPHANQEKQKTTDWDWWLDKSPEILIALFTLFLWLATRRLVKGADETSERQLRAYVMVKRVEIVNIRPDPSKDFFKQWIHVKVKNFGQIPATHLEHWFVIGPGEYRLSIPTGGDRIINKIDVIAPQATLTMRTDIPLMEATALINEHTFLYIHGEIRYFDGFKPDRVTKINFRRRGGHDWQRDGEMETCQEGNDAT